MEAISVQSRRIVSATKGSGFASDFTFPYEVKQLFLHLRGFSPCFFRPIVFCNHPCHRPYSRDCHLRVDSFNIQCTRIPSPLSSHLRSWCYIFVTRLYSTLSVQYFRPRPATDKILQHAHIIVVRVHEMGYYPQRHCRWLRRKWPQREQRAMVPCHSPHIDFLSLRLSDVSIVWVTSYERRSGRKICFCCITISSILCEEGEEQ